jgi:hypothetical protein
MTVERPASAPFSWARAMELAVGILIAPLVLLFFCVLVFLGLALLGLPIKLLTG